jgi:NAD(P)-dependent dehydrogenase (short-subunit alcohol dehydrogenase family)
MTNQPARSDPADPGARACAALAKGALVNVGSVLSWFAVGKAHSVSKAGLWMATNAFRLEPAPDGVQVLGVYAGPTDTPMQVHSALSATRHRPVPRSRLAVTPARPGVAAPSGHTGHGTSGREGRTAGRGNARVNRPVLFPIMARRCTWSAFCRLALEAQSWPVDRSCKRACKSCRLTPGPTPPTRRLRYSDVHAACLPNGSGVRAP